MGNFADCMCNDGKKESKNEDIDSKTDANLLQLPTSNENKDETDVDASNYQLPKTTDLNPSITKNLTYDTKRALAWAHFLSDIWHRHINITHKCEFLNENDDMGNVLQHIVIFGGGPRDYILGDEFDDIDMFLNTRELNKIHLMHLRKYHSKDIITQSDSVKCCYWKLYKNKFQKNMQPKDYQLNATFFARILLNCEELKNKLSVTDYRVAEHTVYMMKLLDDVMYHEYNLKGQDLDLADTFRLEMDGDMKNLNTDQQLLDLASIKQVGKLYHQKSQHIFDTNKDKYISQVAPVDETKQHVNKLQQLKENRLLKSMRVVVTDTSVENTGYNLKEISLPIHATKSRDRFTSNDFSINILVVFVSDFYYSGNIKYEWNVYGSVDTTYLNDGLKDLQNKLLRAPMFDPLYTIKVHYSKKKGSMHFWRLVKFAARYGEEWKVDTKLKEETIKFNPVWLNEDRFTNKLFYETFVFLMIEKYIKKPSEHPKRFKVMNDLEMHKYVVPFFKQKQQFRESLLEKMNSFGEQHGAVIKQELKKYGYMD